MATVLVIAVAACASPSADAPTTTNTGTNATTTHPAATGAPEVTAPASTGGDASTTTTTVAGSPILQIVPYLELTEAERRLVIIEYSHRIEEHIANCMTGEGFEYIPIDPDQPALTGTPEGMPATEEEMRQTYGYGVVFHVRLSYQPLVMELDDPNAAIRQAMSMTEQKAYGPVYGRCMNQARERHPDPFGADSPSEGWLAAQAQQIRQAAWQDPRVQQEIDRWSRCMAKAGYDFAHPDDARDHISELAEPYLQTHAGIDLDQATAAELDELQTVELAVAHTDYACAADLDRTLEQTRWELEAEFIEANADRIAAYVRQHETAIAAYHHIINGPSPPEPPR